MPELKKIDWNQDPGGTPGRKNLWVGTVDGAPTFRILLTASLHDSHWVIVPSWGEDSKGYQSINQLPDPNDIATGWKEGVALLEGLLWHSLRRLLLTDKFSLLKKGSSSVNPIKDASYKGDGFAEVSLGRGALSAKCVYCRKDDGIWILRRQDIRVSGKHYPFEGTLEGCQKEAQRLLQEIVNACVEEDPY